MRAYVGAAVVMVMGLSGCLEQIVDKACVKTNSCVGADMGDLGVGDMHVEGDMPKKQDLLMPPDLTPYCTVATVATSCPSPSAAVCDTTLPVAMCRACTSSSDDAQCAAHSSATPHCNPSSGQCVQCNMNTDCAASATAPICDTSSNACRACKAHSECASGICIFDGATAGACAPSNQVALVNNRGTTVSACEVAHTTRDGTTATTAYCDVSEAVTASSPRPYALVTGSAQPYSAITLATTRTLTIVGPGGTPPSPSPTALLFTATLSPAVTISPTAGQTVTLILDGLELSGSSGTGNQRPGISSSGTAGTATVTVRNSLIDNSGAGGISLSNTDFTLENDVITGNGTSGATGSNFGGISISGTGASNTATAVNLTIADNNSKSTGTTYSGIDCISGAAPIVFNVVLAGNSNTQVNPACTLDHSSYPGGTGTNHDITGCTDAQLFVSSGANPYAPLLSATGSCVLVGKGVASYMSVNVPATDILGARRPTPPSDGAYE